jgi:hypothetical protein
MELSSGKPSGKGKKLQASNPEGVTDMFAAVTNTPLQMIDRTGV